MAVPLSPTSPAPLSPTSSSLTELPTLSAPLFLPTHHTPHAPLPALPGAYALWLVPDAPEKLSSRAEELGYQVFPVPHVALTPWMGVEGEKDGEADLLWKVDKIISEFNRGTHVRHLKLHPDTTTPHPTPGPSILLIPLKPNPALLALSLIARQLTTGVPPAHESNPRFGLAIGFDESGSVSAVAAANGVVEDAMWEVTGVEVWWTGLLEGGKREFRKIGRVGFGGPANGN